MRLYQNLQSGMMKEDYSYFFKILFLISILLNVTVYVLYVFESLEGVFASQTIYIVLLGLNAAILNQLVSIATGLYDALAIPRFPVITLLVQKVVLLILIFGVYAIGILNLEFYYGIQVVITLFTGVVLLITLIKEHRKHYLEFCTRSNLEYTCEFYKYCRPLVLASFMTQLMIMLRS